MAGAGRTARGMNVLGWLSSSGLLWYLNRAAGLVSLVLLTAVLVMGIFATNRSSPSWWPRFATVTLHRSLALLAVSLLGVHVLTAVFDSYVTINLRDVVIPFLGSYRTFWLGLGTLALDVFVAVVITSLVRARLGLRAWRAVHLLVYVAWPVAVIHGLRTGTDATTTPVRLMTAGLVAAVGVATVWRVLPFLRERSTAVVSDEELWRVPR